jgi:flavorubredoxin
MILRVCGAESRPLEIRVYNTLHLTFKESPMTVQEIASGVHFVGAVDWHRPLFDELIPLPQGTSYNAYLVRGTRKTALIDTVDPTKEAELFDHLKAADLKRLDIIVCNHAEQDHSGCIPAVLARYPEAKVATNAKCKEMLKDLLLVPEDRFQVIRDRETLDLGGKTLEFISAPWVHWPETMFTYLREDRLLFTCDFLGAHFAASRLFTAREEKVLLAAKRYYAEIMMPFRTSIRKHLDLLKGLPVDQIAPSHGLIYTEPEFILNAYRAWASDDVENEATILFVSMHGSIQKMVDRLVEDLTQLSVNVTPYNLTHADLGELAMDLVDAATIVVATPVFLAGLHPTADHGLSLVGGLRPKARFLGLLGSYSWGHRLEEIVKGRLSGLKAEFLPPVIAKGLPKEGDLKALDALAETIAQKHRDLGL